MIKIQKCMKRRNVRMRKINYRMHKQTVDALRGKHNGKKIQEKEKM